MGCVLFLVLLSPVPRILVLVLLIVCTSFLTQTPRTESPQAIKNPAVWENMAHLCIKNKRLDVAGEGQLCTGSMIHLRCSPRDVPA